MSKFCERKNSRKYLPIGCFTNEAAPRVFTSIAESRKANRAAARKLRSKSNRACAANLTFSDVISAYDETKWEDFDAVMAQRENRAPNRIPYVATEELSENKCDEPEAHEAPMTAEALIVDETAADQLAFTELCHVNRAYYLRSLSFSEFMNMIGDYSIFLPAKKECDLLQNLSAEEIRDRFEPSYNTMRKVCEEIIFFSGKCPKNYKYSKNQTGSGRIYVIDSGLQSLTSCFRNFLCEGLVADIDMASAHPRYALQLAERYKIDLPFLKSYIDDRAVFLERSGASKSFCTKLMFRDHRLLPNEIATMKNKEMVVGLDNDFKLIQQKIYEENPYGVLGKQRTLGKPFNPMGSMLSKSIVVEENKSLQAMFRYFKSIGIEAHTPMYDGATFDISKSLITDDMLRAAELYAFEETGFTIKLVEKPINTPVKLPEGFECTTQFVVNRDVVKWPLGVVVKEINRDGFVESIDEDMFHKFPRFTGISAGMGLGKTTAVTKLVDRLSKDPVTFLKKARSTKILESVVTGFTKGNGTTESALKSFKKRGLRTLMVSCRQQHARSIQGTFSGFQHYADGVEDENNNLFRTADRLIIQPQSLWKLRETQSIPEFMEDCSVRYKSNFEPYDLVILDELHSTLCSAAWIRNGVAEQHSAENVEILYNLVASAGKVVALDADLLVDPLCMTFATALFKPEEIDIIHYKKPKAPRCFKIVNDINVFERSILNAIDENQGLVWVACGSKKYAERIHGMILAHRRGDNDETPDLVNEEAPEVNEKDPEITKHLLSSMKLYTGNTSPEIIEKDFNNIDLALMGITSAVCTSKITVGADIHVETNRVFVQLSQRGGASATDMRQMTGRPRNLLNSEILVLASNDDLYYSSFERRYCGVFKDFLEKKTSNDYVRCLYGNRLDISKRVIEDGVKMLVPDPVCKLYLQKRAIDAENKLWAFCSMCIHAGSTVGLPEYLKVAEKVAEGAEGAGAKKKKEKKKKEPFRNIVEFPDEWRAAVNKVPELVLDDHHGTFRRDCMAAESMQKGTLITKAVCKFGDFVYGHRITPEEISKFNPEPAEINEDEKLKEAEEADEAACECASCEKQKKKTVTKALGPGPDELMSRVKNLEEARKAMNYGPEAYKNMLTNDMTGNCSAVNVWVHRLLELVGVAGIFDERSPINKRMIELNKSEIDGLFAKILPQTTGYSDWKLRNRRKILKIDQKFRRVLKTMYGTSLISIKTPVVFEDVTGTRRCQFLIVDAFLNSISERVVPAPIVGLCPIESEKIEDTPIEIEEETDEFLKIIT